MPANMSLPATVLGAVTGFFPIGWIVLNVIFLYRLTEPSDRFLKRLRKKLGRDCGVGQLRRLRSTDTLRPQANPSKDWRNPATFSAIADRFRDSPDVG
jgi:L-lactate permease